MTMIDQAPLAEVKNRLSEVVDQVEHEHARVVITKHGRPAAVVVSVADLESLEETLDVMGHEGLLSDIKESVGELKAGTATRLSKDAALRLIHGA
jgi:antitoxin YefM